MSTRDLSKLPKWARQQIEHLETENAKLSNRLEGEVTSVVADPFIKRQYLEDGVTVRFIMERRVFKGDREGEKFDADYFDVSLRDSELHVSAPGRLSVHPSASNLVQIKTEAY